MSKEKIRIKAPDPIYGIQTLKKYIYSKTEVTNRIKSERYYWNERYLSGKGSSWLHNSILNKHADIADNMPTCVCLPREERDAEAAAVLGRIIPVINSRSGFEQIYSDNAWNKIRYGTAVYGVFWDNDMCDGLGDVSITKINIDNIFWEFGVEDIEDSKDLFICALEDKDKLKEKYPHLDIDDKIGIYGDLTSCIYGSDGMRDGKCAVVDWYYKKYVDGHSILHFCKLCEYGVIYSSEEDEACIDGWYSHGRYPVVFDAMYPCDGSVCGFGLIALGRKCEEYIDRLDKNIENYSDLASNVRFWAKKSLGVNIGDFQDTSKQIVEVEGDIDEEKLKRIDTGSMDASVVDIMQMKIDELKEITGCHDVSVGRTNGNVSAASAISMLQSANAKFSRDGIENSCRACVKIWELTLELIRQFYTEERVFRIAGDNGYSYEYFKADNIRRRDDGYCPCFDISIDTHKKTYNERKELNEFALELYRCGAFKSENLEQTKLLLTLVDYEGLGGLKSAIFESTKGE